MNDSDVIAALRRIREEASLTQAELARRMGVDRSAVNRIESGKYAPAIDVMEKWANACGRDLAVEFPLPGETRGELPEDVREVVGLVTSLDARGRLLVKTVARALESRVDERWRDAFAQHLTVIATPAVTAEVREDLETRAQYQAATERLDRARRALIVAEEEYTAVSAAAAHAEEEANEALAALQARPTAELAKQVASLLARRDSLKTHLEHARTHRYYLAGEVEDLRKAVHSMHVRLSALNREQLATYNVLQDAKTLLERFPGAWEPVKVAKLQALEHEARALLDAEPDEALAGTGRTREVRHRLRRLIDEVAADATARGITLSAASDATDTTLRVEIDELYQRLVSSNTGRASELAERVLAARTALVPRGDLEKLRNDLRNELQRRGLD